MGKATGFLEFERRDNANIPVKERIKIITNSIEFLVLMREENKVQDV